IVYRPGVTAGSTKRPMSFDMAVRTRPVDSSVTVTVTPGRILPDWSAALPLISDTAPCPHTRTADRETITATHRKARSMSPPLGFGRDFWLVYVRPSLGTTRGSVKVKRYLHQHSPSVGFVRKKLAVLLLAINVAER